jgi:tyrosyl-tRNA synthetase
LIQQGGVAVNDEKITDPFAVIGADAFAEGYAMIKKGKKTYHKAVKA